MSFAGWVHLLPKPLIAQIRHKAITIFCHIYYRNYLRLLSAIDLFIVHSFNVASRKLRPASDLFFSILIDHQMNLIFDSNFLNSFYEINLLNETRVAWIWNQGGDIEGKGVVALRVWKDVIAWRANRLHVNSVLFSFRSWTLSNCGLVASIISFSLLAVIGLKFFTCYIHTDHKHIHLLLQMIRTQY